MNPMVLTKVSSVAEDQDIIFEIILDPEYTNAYFAVKTNLMYTRSLD